MRPILVTGASGTIGRWCVDALRGAGHDVHALAGPSASGGVDLLDRVEMAGVVERLEPGGLVHLAWETEHGRFWTAAENDAWVEASVALVGAAVRSGVTRVVVAGTCAEYDWRPDALGDGTCVEDTTPIAPATPYGIAKARLHQLLLEAEELRPVSLGWGRIFSMYGPGEAGGRLVPTVTTGLLRGEPVDVSSGSLERDYLHARDVGAALALMFESGVTGAINIGSGHGITIARLVTRLAQLIGRPELVRIADVDGASEPVRLVAAVDRLRHEVGFTPSIDLDRGLRDVIDWWQRQLIA